MTSQKSQKDILTAWLHNLVIEYIHNTVIEQEKQNCNNHIQKTRKW